MFHGQENVSRETFLGCDVVKAFTSRVSNWTVVVGGVGVLAQALELTYGRWNNGVGVVVYKMVAVVIWPRGRRIKRGGIFGSGVYI